MVRLGAVLQGLVPLAIGCMLGYAALTLLQVVYAERSIPRISLTQPNDGATVAGTVSLWAAASDVGFASVSFQVNGVSLGPDITSGSCTRDWDTSQVADGSYALTALARTDDGLSAASAPAFVTVANASPSIFDIRVWNITDSGASITWYTLLPADGQLDFGVSQHYGNRTPLVSESSTIHTQVLSGLASGTSYHFRVYAQNALGRRSASTDQVFTTAGQLSISNVTAIAKATTALITWTTDQPGDTEIRYGAGRFTTGFVVKDAALAQSHSVILLNLTPGAPYVYQVQSRNSQGRTTTSPTLKFTTSPAPLSKQRK